MSSYQCEFCGEELKFRVIGGATIPLHPKGSTCEGKRYYRAENIDKCLRVPCPVCEESVYYVRHNGGSVWFDSLGWPWEQHPCMDRRLHTIPKHWDALASVPGGGLVQLWLYGVIRGEDGGAFWVFDKPRPKPRFRPAEVTRLMCRPEFRDSLEKLDGKLVIKTETGVVTLGGEELREDGPYESPYLERRKKWW